MVVAYSSGQRLLLAFFIIASGFLTLISVRAKNDESPDYLEGAYATFLYWTIFSIPWAFCVVQSARIFVLANKPTRKRAIGIEVGSACAVGTTAVGTSLLLITKPSDKLEEHTNVMTVEAAWAFLFLAYLVIMSIARCKQRILN